VDAHPGALTAEPDRLRRGVPIGCPAGEGVLAINDVVILGGQLSGP
jgi:hypothetical protein